jgi:hypothetical protein
MKPEVEILPLTPILSCVQSVNTLVRDRGSLLRSLASRAFPINLLSSSICAVLAASPRQRVLRHKRDGRSSSDATTSCSFASGYDSLCTSSAIVVAVPYT